MALLSSPCGKRKRRPATKNIIQCVLYIHTYTQILPLSLSPSETAWLIAEYDDRSHFCSSPDTCLYLHSHGPSSPSDDRLYSLFSPVHLHISCICVRHDRDTCSNSIVFFFSKQKFLFSCSPKSRCQYCNPHVAIYPFQIKLVFGIYFIGRVQIKVFVIRKPSAKVVGFSTDGSVSDQNILQWLLPRWMNLNFLGFSLFISTISVVDLNFSFTYPGVPAKALAHAQLEVDSVCLQIYMSVYIQKDPNLPIYRKGSDAIVKVWWVSLIVRVDKKDLDQKQQLW